MQSVDDNVCHVCKDTYGSMSGKHCDDDWLQCNRCCHRFHNTCAEECGMVDKTDYMWELFLADVSWPIPHSLTEVETTDDNGTGLHLTESL